jgi:hypothetical protein
VELFKRWRRSRSELASEPAGTAKGGECPKSVQPSISQPVPASQPVTSARTRRPATMGRSAAEQAYLAQAAVRAKQD